jgi:hypothetical protein
MRDVARTVTLPPAFIRGSADNMRPYEPPNI